MSDDESLVCFLAFLWLIIAVFRHGIRMCSVRPAGHARFARRTVAVSWFVASAVLFLVLTTLSSYDVKDSVPYTMFYFVMGLAWVSLVTELMTWLDWHFREDVLERNNLAASVAQGGAVIGLMLSFAGANIGDGPGWPVVVFCAILSTGGLLLAWVIADRVTGWIGHITVDRDLASGLRAGAFFLAGGLITGRAVAGDWISTGATLEDFFRDGLWLVPLVVLGALAQRLQQPSETSPLGSVAGAVLSALVLLAYASGYLFLSGPIP